MKDYIVQKRFTESGHMTDSFKKEFLGYAEKFVKYHLRKPDKVDGVSSQKLEKAAKEFVGNHKQRQPNKNKCKIL